MASQTIEADASRPSAQIEHIAWDDIDKLRYFTIGPAAFICVRAAVYPSSLVKTRLQVQSSSKPLYNGTFDAFKKIFKSEGPRGLYKGFGANTANVITGNIYISVYELARKFYVENTPVTAKTSNFLGGATASLVSQTVVVPLDIVSQHMMISGQGTRSNWTKKAGDAGVIGITKRVFQREGLRGFYKGYVASLITYAPSSALWWGSYGLLMPFYFDKMQNLDFKDKYKQVVAQATGGASAGAVAAVLTNPMDIVRTRTQIYTNYGMVDAFKYIVQTNGWRGLMTGTTARLMSMIPSGMLVFSTYEFVKRQSRKPESDREA